MAFLMLRYDTESNLCFIIKVLLENELYYPLNFIFENINNRLKKIIMASNRKSVVNDKRIEVAFVHYSFRSITEKFNRLNTECMRVSFYSTNKLQEFVRVHKDLLPCDKKSNLFIRFRVRVAMQVMVQIRRQLRSIITEHKNHIR